MSKDTRETQLQRGERLLKDWGLPDDPDSAALRGAAGRDAAADLAIAARLGALVEPASAQALLAIEQSSRDKLVRKEVRRSLYRLAQRGVPVPQEPASRPAVLAQPPTLEGYLSPVDGRGDQLVWLVKPRAGGVWHLFVVINDPEGMREAGLSETTRKTLRAARQELVNRHELRLVEADWRYCDFVAERAFGWAVDAGRPVEGDYRGLRGQLIQSAATEMPPLILSRLDVEAVRREPRLLVESGELLEEKEFRTWFFDAETLKPYLDEMRSIRDSPLVLSPVQQQERFRDLTQRAIEDLFAGDRRDSWVRRLQEMAYFFDATGRSEQAQRTLAAALALAASAHGGREIPFCESLGRASLAAFWQMEEQQEVEQSRGSLVVTPQQAARELERRK